MKLIIIKCRIVAVTSIVANADSANLPYGVFRIPARKFERQVKRVFKADRNRCHDRGAGRFKREFKISADFILIGVRLNGCGHIGNSSGERCAGRKVGYPDAPVWSCRSFKFDS